MLLIIWASSSASLFLLWLSGTSVWLTAAVIICFLSSPKCDWDSAHRTEGVGGEKERGIKQKTKYPLHGNTPSSSASSSSIHNPLPPQQPLIFILFHHLSISVIPLFFSSTKSVLIANHHKPAKWRIILHSFITKPPSSYFVSQHVQRAQLPCLLIQSASRRKSRQIMPEDGGNSPPQPEMDLNNIPYFFLFKIRHLHAFKTWCSQPSWFHCTSSLNLTSW